MSVTRLLTASILQDLMPSGSIWNRGYCYDLDTCWTSGIYTVSLNLSENIPEGAHQWGLLLVLAGAGNVAVQIYIPDTGDTERPIFIRIKYGDSQLRKWMTIPRSLI